MRVRGALASRRSVGRRGLRGVLATLFTGLLLAGSSVLLGSPAQAAADLDCTPMGDPACRNLVPLVECVWRNADGTQTVVWGYSNPSSTTLHIDLGNHNDMSPGDPGQGQPVDFQTGTQHNVFTSTVPASVDISWRLGNTTVSASDATAQCPSKPVSVIGSVTALAAGVGFLVLAGVALVLGLARRAAPLRGAAA